MMKGFQHDNRAPIGATSESIWKVLVQIRKDETFVTSNASKVQVGDIIHSWATKTPRTIGDRASVQGADPVYDNTDTGRTSNLTQLIQVGYQLTSSRLASNAIGKDPMAQEKDEAMNDFKDFLEFAVVRGTMVSGNDSTAAKMKGLKAFASTLLSSQSGISFSEGMANDIMALGFLNGTKLNSWLVGTVLKNRINAFSGGATKYVAASEESIYGNIDIIKTSYGTVKINLHRFVTVSGDTNNDFVAYDMNFVKLGELDPVKFQDNAVTGTAKQGECFGEYTLQVDTELGVAVTTKLL